jgi:carboxylesterase
VGAKWVTILRIMTTKHYSIMQGAEPFFHRGGDVGILCLHGFTANPSEVRWLGSALAGRSFTVLGTRAAGHGTHPHDLARTHWQDWYASAQDGVHVLRAQCRAVYVVGHSMGGLLALLLAGDGLIDAASVLASPIELPTLAMSRWFRYLRPFTDQPDTSGLIDIIRAEQARRNEEVIGRVRYDQWSTAAVYQLYLVAEAARAALPNVQAPLQLIYSLGDKTVPAAHMARVATGVRSRVIERHTLQTSGHILPQDSERETVFTQVGDFFARQAATNAQSPYRQSPTG